AVDVRPHAPAARGKRLLPVRRTPHVSARRCHRGCDCCSGRRPFRRARSSRSLKTVRSRGSDERPPADTPDMRRSGATRLPAQRLLVVTFCLTPLALLAAGCFSATPTQQDLLVNAARSLSGTKSVRLDGAVQVSVTRGARTESWSAELHGGVAKPAISLAGSVGVDTGGGESKTYPFALRLAAKTLYAQING